MPLDSLIPTEQPGSLRPDDTVATVPSELQPFIPSDVPLQDRPQSRETLSIPGNFAVGPQSDIVSLNQEAKRSAEGLRINQDVTGVLDQIQKQTRETSGFWPHVLATLAALNGQFGPAIALQEQVRKSKILEQTTPAFVKANELANSGRLQESVEFLQKVAASIGDRAPEAQKVFQAAIEKISAKQQAFEKFRVYTEGLNEIVPKDDPSRPIVNFMMKAAKSNMPFTIDMAKELMGEPNITVQNGMTYNTSKRIGTTKVTPNRVFTSETDIKDPQIAGPLGVKYGKTVPELLNIVNLQPDSSLAASINSDIAQLKSRQAQFAVGAMIPRSPAFLQGMQRLPGMTPEIMAKGEFTPDQIRQASEYEAQHGALAQKYQPLAPAGVGLVAVQGNAEAPDFGSYKEGLSQVEAQQQGMFHIPRTVLTDKVQPAMTAISGLNYARDMYKTLSTMGVKGDEVISKYDRFGQGLMRIFQEQTNFVPTEGMTVANAMRAIANRSVEEIENTKTIDDRTIRELKNGITGGFADPEAAGKAVDVLQGRMKEKLGVFMGQQKSEAGSYSPINSGAQGHDVRGTQQDAAVRQQTAQVADAASQQFGIRPQFVRAILAQESDTGTFTKHREGDGYGPMQITHNKAGGNASTAEAAAQLIGVPLSQVLNDHNTNIYAGTALLSQLVKRHNGNEWLAARDYNGSGPAAEAYASRVTGKKSSTAVEKIASIVPKTKEVGSFTKPTVSTP